MDIGEMVIYGSNGVCRIADIRRLCFPHIGEEKLYYVLEPQFTSETIYAPMDTEKMMRPLMTSEQVHDLIHQMPHIEQQPIRSSGALNEWCQEVMQLNQSEEVIRLIKSIYAKNEAALLKGKKIGQIDQRCMQKAEELLYGEFSVVLGIPREDVKDYISEEIEHLEASAVIED